MSELIHSVYSNAFNEESSSKESTQTELFVAIHDRRWDNAIELLEGDPSRAREWSTKIAYDGEVSWTRLPIHQACIQNAPKCLVQALLVAFPASAAATDVNKRLPLHYASVHGADCEVIELLVKSCPGAVDVIDDYGKTPSKCILSSATFASKEELNKKVEVLSTPFLGLPLVTFKSDLSSFDDGLSCTENETKLFSAIAKKEWDSALERIKRNNDEVNEWTIYKNSNGEIVWKRLPIHEASINNAPGNIVNALLKAYKYGATERDFNMRLPLHHAAVHGSSPDVLECLIKAYPDSLDKEDVFGKIPFKYLKLPDCDDSSTNRRLIELLSKPSSSYKDMAINPKQAVPPSPLNDDIILLHDQLAGEKKERQELNKKLNEVLSHAQKMEGLMAEKNLENEHLKSALSSLQKEFSKLERDVFSQGSPCLSIDERIEVDSFLSSSMASFDSRCRPLTSITLKDRSLKSLRTEVKERENMLGNALQRARSPVQTRE